MPGPELIVIVDRARRAALPPEIRHGGGAIIDARDIAALSAVRNGAILIDIDLRDTAQVRLIKDSVPTTHGTRIRIVAVDRGSHRCEIQANGLGASDLLKRPWDMDELSKCLQRHGNQRSEPASPVVEEIARAPGGASILSAAIELDRLFTTLVSNGVLDFTCVQQAGDRVVEAEDYFIGPDVDITRLHILQPGDLLTTIRIPATWSTAKGSQHYFEKVRDRNVWDFPLLNVAAAKVVSDGRIERVRIAVNGAAARPLRLKRVEDAVRGKPANRTVGEMAGRLAIEGAVPLQFNGYKIPLMRNLVMRALCGVEEARWTS